MSTGQRSTLSWLYDTYRTAVAAKLRMFTGKPGEWLEVAPKTPEAGFISEAAVGMDTGSATGLHNALKYLAGLRLNNMLGVACDDDVRITYFRNGTSKTLFIRFFTAAPGKKRGSPQATRFDLPPLSTAGDQSTLIHGEILDSSAQSEVGVRQAPSSQEQADGLLLENSHVSADRPNTERPPAIDYASVFDVEDFERFLVSGEVNNDSEIGKFVAEAIEEARAAVQGHDDVDPLDIINALTEKLGSPTEHSPMLDLEAPEPVEWHTASRQVVESTLSICHKYRNEKGKLAILCPSPSGGKPLHEDTLVTMSDGSLRPIKSLAVGDRVISGAGRVTTVAAVYDQGPLDVLKITTRSGRSVIAEGTHRFLTQRGWVEAGQLRAYDRNGWGNKTGKDGEKLGRGDALQLGHSMERLPTSSLSEAEARFLGYMTGDGGATQATEKRVPAAIFTATDRAIAEFVGAYFECDGTRRERASGKTWRDGGDPPTASFSSTSRGLLADVQTLLGRLGIRTSLRVKNGIYNGNRHVSWRLSVLDLCRFFDLIPVVGAKSGTSRASRRREPTGRLAPDPVMTVEAAGQARCLCITVSDDESFLANDFVTHNTHGMIEAARADRAAGKRVGYAVLARGKLMEEAKERLTGGAKQLVQLHVIEGRHAGNCVEYESVEQAAALGYAPGTQVCPKCDKYPSLSNPFSSLDRNATCEYYAARLRAIRDMNVARQYNNPLIRPYPVILTTHAGLAIGAAMHARGQKTFRSQPSLWQFDTIFIDEDPTGALEQTYVIKEDQLVYQWKDQVTNRPDAHTQMTRVLRGMFTLARAERKVAWSNGYKDTIHTRDHGSTYASNDLIGLLSRAAKSLGYDLEEVLAQVENESDVKSPKRGELLSIKAEIAAERYPHRYLATLSQAIRHEILTRKNAPGQGAGLDLAYRVHMDLTLVPDHDPMTSGETTGTITLAITNPFATNDANIIIGDAYASIEHYENLFRRFRRHGDVDIVNHRVKWPQSSLLIRIPTRCGSGDFPTDASYLEHCDKALLPLLSMEQDRRVLLYTHKGSRELLDEWINQKAGELGLETYAIEHWGSGRGKDIYRDFDTFIAASEYLPNIYGLVHEANSRVAQSNALTPRIYFWNAGMRRESGASLTDTITSTAPALSNAFQRRAVDELAQAIHRIRPAKPRPCETCGQLLGRDPRQCEACGALQPPARWQKRCWVLGYHVPMSMELLAATCTTTIDKETRKITREGRDHRGRGAQVKVHPDLGLLSFLSDREVATAIGDVFREVGCWSPAFTHTLEGVPLSAAVSRALYDVVFGAAEGEPGEPFSDPGMGSSRFGATPQIVPLTAGPAFGESSRLVDRVYSPPAAWQAIADRITTLPMYRAGLKLFFEEAASRRGRPLQRFHVRRDWMKKGSHGVLCFGDPRRLEAIIEYYGPNPPPVPF